jgi:hypothetical protein
VAIDELGMRSGWASIGRPTHHPDWPEHRRYGGRSGDRNVNSLMSGRPHRVRVPPLPVRSCENKCIRCHEQDAVKDLPNEPIGRLVLDATVPSADERGKRIAASEVVHRLVEVQCHRPDHGGNSGQSSASVHDRDGHGHGAQTENTVPPGEPEEPFGPARLSKITAPVRDGIQREMGSHSSGKRGGGTTPQGLADEDAGEDVVRDEHGPTVPGPGSLRHQSDCSIPSGGDHCPGCLTLPSRRTTLPVQRQEVDCPQIR